MQDTCLLQINAATLRIDTVEKHIGGKSVGNRVQKKPRACQLTQTWTIQIQFAILSLF